MDVVCLGEIILDMFPAEVGRPLAEVSAFRPVPGGAPANVAVACARLGVRSAFIGKVGEDAFGRRLVETLRREGVDTRGMRFSPEARTTLNFMAQPDRNSYDCLFYRNPGADMLLSEADLDRELLWKARVFHFGSISLIAEPNRSATLAAISIARQQNAVVSFDVNYRPTLWPQASQARERILGLLGQVDVLKVNETECQLLTGEAEILKGAAVLKRLGPAVVLVTLGSLGSAFCADRSGQVAGFAVDTVDATGCGDAFMGAVLYAVTTQKAGRASLAGMDWPQALRFANAAGALTAQKQGVIPALPTAPQVLEFLGHDVRK